MESVSARVASPLPLPLPCPHPPPPPLQAFWNLPLLGSLNYRVNFQTFPAAMLVLLRIATTDNWSDFFFQMIPGNPACLAYEVQGIPARLDSPLPPMLP